MAINAKDYLAKLPPDEQKKIAAHAEEMIAQEMNLAELRNALQRSQAEVAEKCGIKQAEVSRLERRGDMRISPYGFLIDNLLLVRLSGDV